MRIVAKISKRKIFSRDGLPPKAKRCLDFTGMALPKKRHIECMPDMDTAALPGYQGNGWLRAVKVKLMDIPWEGTEHGISARSITLKSHSDLSPDIIDLLTPCTVTPTEMTANVMVFEYFTWLPTVVLHKIVMMCDIQSALRLSQTCRLFFRIIDTCWFWESRLLQDLQVTSLWGAKYYTKLRLVKGEYQELFKLKQKGLI